MTIVAAYKDPKSGEVWIGADSRCGSSGYIFQTSEPKLHRCGDWWIGHAGTGRAVQLFKDHIAAHKEPVYETPRHLVEDFFGLLKGAGFKADDDAKSGPDYGQELLIARPGELYEVSVNAVITAPSWGFAAIGSGASWAEGAAWALHNSADSCFHPHATFLLERSLQAALAFRSDCGGEIVIQRVG
jgi:ATP-dependent protease HslVU (ClpYQ) peptidase subunit